MQGPLHPPHSHQRGRDQQRAKRNLNAQQNIAQSKAAKTHHSFPAALHHLRRIGSPDLPCRQQTKQNAAAQRQQNRDSVHPRIRIDTGVDRESAKGCQRLNPSSSPLANKIPTVPPSKETRTDSVSSCPSIRPRVDPTARRMANSRLRSAARAEKMLPRLAHAASKTSSASSIMPSRKARTGPPRHLPSVQAYQTRISSSSGAGYCLASWLAIVFRFSVACCGVTPGFNRPSIRIVDSAPQTAKAFHLLLVDHRSPEIGPMKISVP